MSKEIERLKKQLRREYIAMQKARPDYDCGNHMAKIVSGSYSAACSRVNATLNELAALDPATPTERF